VCVCTAYGAVCNTHTHVHAHTYTFTHMHTHTHVNTQTHTHTQGPFMKGAVCNTLGWFVAWPFEVLKSRVQVFLFSCVT